MPPPKRDPRYPDFPTIVHALAYAAGMARRLGRPLLLAYITSPNIFCEPLSGQVIAPARDSNETHRWLLAELD